MARWLAEAGQERTVAYVPKSGRPIVQLVDSRLSSFPVGGTHRNIGYPELQAIGVRLSGFLRPLFNLGGEAGHGHLKQT